jgi:hypothetical protein
MICSHQKCCFIGYISQPFDGGGGRKTDKIELTFVMLGVFALPAITSCFNQQPSRLHANLPAATALGALCEPRNSREQQTAAPTPD